MQKVKHKFLLRYQVSAFSRLGMAFILIIGLLISCKKDEFETLSPIEKLGKCRELKLEDVERVRRALPGTWELAHFEWGGWSTGSDRPSPEIKITFTNQDGVSFYKDENGIEEIPFTWTVEKVTQNFFTRIVLHTEPFRHELNMDGFCDRFMYIDNRVLDGHLYFYEKNN